MNKTLKISLIALMACLAIAALGAWYAASFINPAQLTKLLSSSVKESTGRDLKITGPVSLSLFPSISVKAEQISIGNASWASNPNFLTFKQIELDISIWPLLSGNVEINRIGVSGLEMNLQTNKAGEGNWNLTPPALAASSPPNQASNSSSTGSTFVALKTLDVMDARISYQDVNQAVKVINLPKASIGNSYGKATINIDAQYANYTLNLKGKSGSIRNTYFAWGQAPVKMDLDLILTLNGKSLAITGEVDKQPQTMAQFKINLNSKSFDLAPLAGSAVVAGAAGKAGPTTTHQAQGKYFFSDDALPFDMLPLADGSIKIDIAELGVPDQAPFTNFKTTLQFKNDRIDANDLSFNVGKGKAQGQLSISEFSSPSPKISFRGMAKDFSLEQIVPLTDSHARVSGAATQVAWNVKGSGISPHQFVSRASGAIQVSVGQGALDAKFINKGGDFVITVFDAVNPLYKKSTQTTLECAVAYLPIKNGIVNIKDSVGFVTDRLNIVLSGSINLNSEALDINISPTEKSGLTTGIDLGGLVKVEGTLQNPQVGVNKTGVVNSAVSIGLGFLTGGLSIAAENAKSLATKVQPCKTALHSWSDIYPTGN
ncbi:AsmA family protein [Polynucleobacter ibericus]|uniref:AsmA family protein n=1 Tax=Polynucleobacter ibericus TaxID=1819725 RepID=UPI001BFECF3F|nr:AsmA family protein [Polynucleobacter ibericus]QWE08009.1 AsmA family protein [Polynucleobacter ibericus]